MWRSVISTTWSQRGAHGGFFQKGTKGEGGGGSERASWEGWDFFFPLSSAWKLHVWPFTWANVLTWARTIFLVVKSGQSSPDGSILKVGVFFFILNVLFIIYKFIYFLFLFGIKHKARVRHEREKWTIHRTLILQNPLFCPDQSGAAFLTELRVIKDSYCKQSVQPDLLSVTRRTSTQTRLADLLEWFFLEWLRFWESICLIFKAR